MDKENINAQDLEDLQKPLEVPEVVPVAAAVDFPEITDFLKNMKIRGSMFGFQKEDVYEKMQDLNKLYQDRMQQMREQTKGQIKQMKKQQQQDQEEIRTRMYQDVAAARTQLEQEFAKTREELERQLAETENKRKLEQEELRSRQEKELEAARLQLQEELIHARVQLRAELEDKNRETLRQQTRELEIIREEMGRLIERLMLIKKKVNSMTDQDQMDLGGSRDDI